MQRSGLKYFFIYVSLVFSTVVYSGELITTDDSLRLEQLYSNEQYALYFDELAELRDCIVFYEDYTQYVSLGHFFNRYFEFNCDSNNIKLLRRAYANYAHRFWKKFSDFYKAEEYYLKAHKLLVPRNDDFIFYVENELGTIYTRWGDYDRAHYYYSMAEEFLECLGNYESLIKTMSNHGKCFRDEGKYNEAIDYFKGGEKLSSDINYLRGLISNNLYYGQLLIETGHYREAEVKLNNVIEYLKYYKDEDDKVYKNSLLYQELGNLKYKLKLYSQAITYFKKSIFYYEKIDGAYVREVAQVNNLISTIYLEQGFIEKANEYSIEGIKKIIKEYDQKKGFYKELIFGDNILTSLISQRIKIELKRKADPASIIHLYDMALLSCTHRLNNIGGDDSVLKIVKENKEVVNQVIDYCHENLDKVDLHHIRFYFDHSKSILLESKYAINKNYSSLQNEDKIRVMHIENEIHRLSKEEGIATVSEIKRFKLYQEKLSILNKNKNIVKDSVIENNYIEYCFTDSFLYSYSVINAIPQFKRIVKKEKIEQIIEPLNKCIVDKCSDIYELLELPSQLLIKDIENRDLKKITFITDGCLNMFPFEILTRKNKYLIESVELNYQFSRRISNVISADYNIFCLAPSYSGLDVANLKFAVNELNSINHQFKDKDIVTGYVNKEKINLQLKKYSIFHFIGHAAKDLYGSYLYLSKNDKLSSKDIATSTFNTPLVVLNACQTGEGNYFAGEGTRSIGRSFLESGASSVIFTLWPINDEVAAGFMEKFYSNLSGGQSISNALRNCKLAKINSSSIETRHPYYWSAFIGVTNDVSFKQQHHVPAILLIIAGVIIIFFTIKKFIL